MLVAVQQRHKPISLPSTFYERSAELESIKLITDRYRLIFQNIVTMDLQLSSVFITHWR